MKTAAQKFKIKADELMPDQSELQDLDDSINLFATIDDIMFRKSEYIGGMSVVILRLI